MQFHLIQKRRTNTLSASELGVAIGTYEAQEALHVYAQDNSFLNPYDEVRILVENNVSETAVRTMLELVNNGGSRIVFDNSNSGEAWALIQGPQDQFMLSRGGTGGAELVVRKDGTVFMGPGNQSNFILAKNGNLTIKGALNQQSDRNAKTAFEEIDADDVLDRVVELPIQSWQYKDDNAAVRHIGPTAQDFKAAFDLGESDQSIATVDTSGVALVAIQALKRQLEERDARISELEDRLNSIESLLPVEK